MGEQPGEPGEQPGEPGEQPGEPVPERMPGEREVRLDRRPYELEVEDTFQAETLDTSLWFPCYLPQWSSRAASAARYEVGGGRLRLRVDADQPPWCPELDGGLRVSSLQTGVVAGPLGSRVGQHRFHPDAVVREEQEELRLWTPHHGLVEVRLRATDDPHAMVAMWLIGVEDRPARSAEICVVEIFGRDVQPDAAAVGMGLHPFGDPTVVDDFARPVLAIDAREPHTYAAEWTRERVRFFCDGVLVRSVEQSPDYPMQVMLGVYAFPDRDAPPPGPYPKVLDVEWFRGYRRR